MIRIFFVVIIAFFCLESFSQNDCSDNLKRARQNFEDGYIEDIPSLLIPCLDEGFSKEEKISAYKLIVLTYLFDDNQNEAEAAILNFFKDFPNYEIRTDDPAEFVYLIESYEAVPVYSVYGSFGVNQSIIHTLEPRSTSPSPDSKSYRFGNMGVNFIAGGSYSLNEYVKNLSANIRLELSQYNFDFEETVENTAIVNFTEKQTRINLPLFASYDLTDIIPEFQFNPEIYLGCNLEFITSAKGTPKKEDDSGNPVTSPEKSIKSQRRTFEPGLLVGANLSYPVTKGEIFVDVHSKIRFSSQAQGDRIANDDLKWSRTNYLDDEFSLHNIFFSIGYRYTFYKPIKVR